MDGFDTQTRLVPALFVLSPLTIAAATIVPWDQATLLGGSFLAATGLHVLVAWLVRDHAKTVERRLWMRWGGAPTTIELRWKSAQRTETHQKLHERVTRFTGIALPNADEEKASPEAADDAYGEATLVLRERTRNRSNHSRVYAELVNYTRARNFYSLRALGLAIALIVGVAGVVLATAQGVADLPWSPPMELVIPAAVYAGIAAAAWMFVATETRVRRHGDRYADALLSASAAGRS